MITAGIEIVAYMYICLNMVYNFNQYRLMSFITMTNYFLFGMEMSMYITLLNVMYINHKYIPITTSFIYNRIHDTIYVKKLQELIIAYKINTMISVIMTMGDISSKLIETVMLYVISKIQKQPMVVPVTVQDVTERIDDFMESDDETFQRINNELDNLLSIGTNIITQTMSGRKEEQKENVNTFMNKFTLLFGKKTN